MKQAQSRWDMSSIVELIILSFEVSNRVKVIDCAIDSHITAFYCWPFARHRQPSTDLKPILYFYHECSLFGITISCFQT